MPAPGIWNLGSVQDEIFARVSVTIPTSISGTSLNNVINERLQYVNDFLGTNVGNTAITLPYQGPLISLSIGETLDNIEGMSSGQSKDIKIGEMSIKKSASSGGEGTSAMQWTLRGEKALNQLKNKASFYKAYG